ncbi:MAG: HAD-IB family hydrolase [Ilumatobacteraceae bacterium]
MTNPAGAPVDLSRWSAVLAGGSAPRPVVAAFDVDRTVTTRDCVMPFLRQVRGTLPFAARFGASLLANAPAVIRRDRSRLKAVAARAALAGRPMAEVQQLGEEFADDVVASRLRLDTLARMTWHHDRGHDVLFVSASFAVYLRPLARRLGLVTGVLGTELVVGSDGRCTGELHGDNCRGPEKVRRLHRWLDEHRGGRGAVELWAYGDSPGDRELLADADTAVWAADPLEPAP